MKHERSNSIPEQRMPSLSDLRSNAPGAWEDLYKNINPLLVRIGNTRAPGRGEDVAQATWENFLKTVKTIREDSNLHNYLTRAAVNNGLNLRNKESGNTIVYNSEFVSKLDSTKEIVPSQRVEDEVVGQIRRKDILDEVTNPDQKKVLFLASEGYRNTDMSKDFDLNRLTVGTRLIRGLETLRKDKEKYR